MPAVPATSAVIRVLSVEDNPDDTELTALALERADPGHRYTFHRVEDAEAFTAALDQPFDVILCDFNLPRFSPYAALQILLARRSTIPLILLTRAIGEDAAVHVLRCGAKDYVTKDRLGTLAPIIARVMEERQRAHEKDCLDIELEAAYQRLKRLSARLVEAQERERTLISRELHDQLGQTLNGVVIHLHAAERARDKDAARAHTQTAIDMANGAVQQLKSLSFALRPAQLDLLGLTAAAQSAVQQMAEAAGLVFVFRTRGREPSERGVTASVVMRLLQEALTNVARHARATQVAVRLRFQSGGRIGLLVIDDGVGFDQHALLGGQPTQHNMGLYGMIERAELVGGRLHFRTRAGHGTAVRAVL